MRFSLVGRITAEGHANWKDYRNGNVHSYKFKSNGWIGKYKIYLRHVSNESDLMPSDDGCIFEYHTKLGHNTYEKACCACEEEIRALGIDPWNPTIEILK